MLAALALILAAQADPALEEARAAERARIAAKRPLTGRERAGYSEVKALPPSAGPARTGYRLAVIATGFEDAPAPTLEAIEPSVAALTSWYATASDRRFELSWTITDPAALAISRAGFAGGPTGGREEKKRLLVAASGVREADGVLFVAAGEIGARGTSLWPHMDALEFSDRRLDYLVVPAVLGRRGPAILAHEFGHLLGLEDKYEDPEARVNRWCLMGRGYLGDANGDPMPLCGVCREALGWATAGIARSGEVVLKSGELVRVPLVRDGREALVLEMRERLLVWHTGGGRAIELVAIVPTAESDRLTPWSEPPFRARLKGALEIWLTDIRIEAGRAWVRIAETGEPTPLEALRRSRRGRELGK